MMINTGGDISITFPQDLTEDEQMLFSKVHAFQEEYSEARDRTRTYKANKIALYQKVLELCSKQMRTTLTGVPGYEKAKIKHDPIWLLKSIKGICLRYDAKIKKSIALSSALESILSFRQKNRSNDDYYKEFIALVDVYEQYGGTFGHLSAYEDDIKSLVATSSVTEAQARKKVRERVLASSFLERADTQRYGSMKRDLANDYSLSIDKYPESIANALSVLNSWRDDRRRSVPAPTSPDGFLFAQNEELVPGKDGKIYFNQTSDEPIVCFGCNCKGHYAGRNCPNENRKDQVRMPAITLSLSHLISPKRLLLDSCSTVTLLSVRRLLRNIRRVPRSDALRVVSTGGTTISNERGKFGDLDAWYRKGIIANILSLAKLSSSFTIVFDNSKEDCFVVRLKSGNIRFIRVNANQYYFDYTSHPLGDVIGELFIHSNVAVSPILLNTTSELEAKFSAQEVRDAKKAMTVNERLLHQSPTNFYNIVNGSFLRNNPITTHNIRISERIYGPSLPSHKSRAVRKQPKRVITSGPIHIPRSLHTIYQNVTVCIDFFS